MADGKLGASRSLVNETDSSDFFVPWHHSHLIAAWRQTERLLALPPGTRFLIAPGQEDVWDDPELLNS